MTAARLSCATPACVLTPAISAAPPQPCSSKPLTTILVRANAARSKQIPHVLLPPTSRPRPPPSLTHQDVAPVVHQHCCRQVHRQLAGERAGPYRLPQPQHLLQPELALEQHQNPAEAEEVGQRVQGRKVGVQRRVQCLWRRGAGEQSKGETLHQANKIVNYKDMAISNNRCSTGNHACSDGGPQCQACPCPTFGGSPTSQVRSSCDCSPTQVVNSPCSCLRPCPCVQSPPLAPCAACLPAAAFPAP